MTLSPGGNIAIFVVFMVIDLIACGARMWSRWLMKRRLRAEDYLIIFSTAMGVAYSAVEFYAIVDAGSGQPSTDLGPDASQKLALEEILSNVSGPLWAFGSAGFKLSILFLLYHIFEIKWFRRITMGMMVIIVLWLISLLLAVWLICIPLDKEWDPSIPGKCGSERGLILAYAVSPMIIDVIIMVLPLPVLWRLQMPTRRKVGLSIMFGLSFGAVATNAVRTGIAVNYTVKDLTQSNQLQGILQDLELTLGIMIASAPLLQPVATQIKGTMRTAVGLTRESSRTKPGGGYKLHQRDKQREGRGLQYREEVLLQVTQDQEASTTPSPGNMEPADGRELEKARSNDNDMV